MAQPYPRPGVCYATTDDGLSLPVVDITNPAFACAPSEDELAAIADATFRAFARWERTPSVVRWFVSRRSITMRMLQAARGSFVSGIATYLFKLGPENLGPYASRIDRHLNAALSPVCVRLRLRAVARQLADALAPRLEASPGPLSLLNIGGGTAIDSFNALILLRDEHPDLLRGRGVAVLVLDCDEAGPHFGARALAALLSADGPLHGLNATFRHVPYDWSNVSTLRHALAALPPGSVTACSSEGGLFEYGRDGDIIANLRTLRECGPPDLPIVGSLLRDSGAAARVRENAGMPSWQQIPLREFEGLVRSSGWTMGCAEESNPLYAVFTLARNAAPPANV